MPVCGSSTEEGGHDWLTLFLKSLMSETGCLQALDAFYDANKVYVQMRFQLPNFSTFFIKSRKINQGLGH